MVGALEDLWTEGELDPAEVDRPGVPAEPVGAPVSRDREG
jgi:hypothetical protein